ncbi:MAG TPA: formyltransferase family protein [Candidatus Eisenbacteria bacterium]|nr:formyltransferase family protein [Candidatus Eisenbacteria bacterium]
MKIFVLTQEDAFYIPRILDLMFERRRDIVGVGIVPGELRRGHALKYLSMMGPRDFALQLGNLAFHRFMDLWGRFTTGARSYSVTGAARRAGVPSEVVPKVNDPEFSQRLESLGVDLIVSIACPQKIGARLLALPSRGCINLHGALLPRYQGMLPSFWVLAKGEQQTGVTVHWMDEKLDHGDVLLQEHLAIEPADTVHSLVLRSKVELGRHLLLRAIDLIERGVAPRQPMDLSKASYFSYPDPAAIAEFRARGRRFI